MVVVNLVGVVGDVTETENAVVAGELRHLSSDGKVSLSDHIHRGVVVNGTELVGKVGLSEHLVRLLANEGVKVTRLRVGPVVQVLLEMKRNGRSSDILGLRILDRGVSALVDGVGAVARGITYKKGAEVRTRNNGAR